MLRLIRREGLIEAYESRPVRRMILAGQRIELQTACYTNPNGRGSRVTARLVHRGPDDEGVWSEDGIGLGHTRLAILDLSATRARALK